MRILMLAAVLALAACQTGPARAPAMAETGAPIVLGQSFRIDSRELGQTRTLNVYLPPGYEAGAKRYPVLYVIDGGVEQDFVHIAGLSQHATISGSFREMIVMGIETEDRRRELAFPATQDESLRKDYPTHGESARFRAYIANEVKPWVEVRYRTDGQDAVIGESLAGLFILETFLKQPELFDGYAAIDPSLWWDNGALARTAAGLLAAHKGGERSVYMAVAQGAPLMRAGQALAAKAMQDKPSAGLAFKYVVMNDEQHSTIYHRAALEALRLLFANPGEAN